MDELQLRILFLEDNSIDADLVARELRKAGFNFVSQRVETREAFTEQCQTARLDLILADFSLPTFDGLSALQIAKEHCPDVPFILVSGALGEETAVDSLRLGATDYVLKQRLARLALAVTRALREAEERRERQRAELDLAHSQKRMVEIVESIRDGLFTLDYDWRFTYANYRAVENFGMTIEQLIGQNLWELYPALLGTSVENHYRKAMQERVPQKFETDGILPGTSYDVRVYPSAEGISVYWIDITERKRWEKELAQANEELKDRANQLQRRNHDFVLLNEMGGLLESCQTVEEAYRVIAQSARKIFSNDCGALYVISNSRDLVETGAVWGYPPVCQIGLVFKPDDCWALRRGQLHIVQDVTTSMICAHVRDHVEQGVLGSYLCIPMLAQGEMLGIFYLQSSTKGISMERQQIAVTVAEHLALALASIRLRETLRQMAIRDPLTGLFNRRYFAESLERELHRAKRHDGQVGVIMMDLDHFKDINDTFGHDVGDAVLRSLSHQLQIHLRKEDVVCRYGGEEFAIILPDTTLAIAEKRAEGLRTSIQAISLSESGQGVTNISASFGLAVFPTHGETAAKLVKASDTALYQAKRAGRNRVVVAA